MDLGNWWPSMGAKVCGYGAEVTFYGSAGVSLISERLLRWVACLGATCMSLALPLSCCRGPRLVDIYGSHLG